MWFFSAGTVCVCCFVGILYIRRRGSLYLASPLPWHLAFSIVFFVLGTIYPYFINPNHLNFPPGVQYFPLAMLYAGIFAGFMVLCYIMVEAFLKREKFPPSSFNHAPAPLAAFMLAVLTGVVWYTHIVDAAHGALTVGGTYEVDLPLQQYRFAIVARRLIYPLLACCYIMVLGKKSYPKTLRVFAFIVILAEFGFWMLWGQRLVLVEFVLLFVVVYVLVRGRFEKRNWVWVVGAVVGLMLMVSAYKIARGRLVVIAGKKRADVWLAALKERGKFGKGWTGSFVFRLASWRLCGADFFSAILHQEDHSGIGYVSDIPVKAFRGTVLRFVLGRAAIKRWSGAEPYLRKHYHIEVGDTMITRPCEAYATLGLSGLVIYGLLFGGILAAVFNLLAMRRMFLTTIIYGYWFPILVRIETGMWGILLRAAAVSVIMLLFWGISKLLWSVIGRGAASAVISKKTA